MDTLEALAVSDILAKLREEQRILVNLADDRWRMGIDDDLSKWIVRADRVVCPGSDLFEEPEHRGYAFWVDAVLGLLQTEDSLGDGIELNDRQSEKAEGTVRQRPGGMLSTVLAASDECLKLALRINVNVYFADVVNEIREAIGDVAVDSRWIGSGRAFPRRNQRHRATMC